MRWLLALGLMSVGVAMASPASLQQSGRVLDGTGAPISGTRDLTVALVDGSGTVVWSTVYDSVAFEQGYYAVVMDSDDTGRTIEQALANGATEVSLTVEGEGTLAPNSPLHAVPQAVQAAGVAVETGLIGTSCSASGLLRYDLAASSLTVCTDGSWEAVASRGLGTGITFTNCGKTGRFGPTQAQCVAEYSGQDALLDGLAVSNGIQSWTVPRSGVYRIEAWGAQGGGSYGANCPGGYGGYARADVELLQGAVLDIVVGQAGGWLNDHHTVANAPAGSANGSGGGGTFVVRAEGNPLVIGGGGGGRHPTHATCNDASMQGGQTVAHPGQGGGPVQDSDSGGGGGGLLTNGTTSTGNNPGNGGRSFANGATGGFANQSAGYTYYQDAETASGGFGGGGGARYWSSSAGGGGYYGGRGWNTITAGSSSSGGTSYVSGTNTQQTAGVRTGHGQVTITWMGTTGG